ncbi:MAG: tail fiber domain-containing protein, partial [Hyphomicrobium sp.]|nr:tail fiber domain-containing protein [Hyphomicrobium sp.]
MADLTDVSVAGASTGSILAYNGSSWVVSSTVSASAALGDRIVSGTAVAYISPTGTVFINGRLELVTGTGVIGIGPDAARRNTGDYAVVIGSAAGEENSAGYLSALGTSAGRYNTGMRLTTVGDFSAWLNTGDYVSGFGSGAAMHNQGNNVTALGAYAGWGVSGSTPAHNSTFVGYSSGVNVSGAERNTFVGAESGGNVVSGDDNILIGYQAYTPAPGTNSFLNIGNAISGTMTAGGSLTFKGGVKAAGIVTATFFEGDGSRLTNLPSGGATDRIVSGTNGGTSMIAISNTGFISITQNGGVNTGWFDPTRGLVTLGVSAAGAVSGSFGYFEGMQLGSGAVAGALSSTGFLRLIGVAPYVESYGTAPLVVFRYARQTKGAPLAPNANQQVARLATSLYGSGIFGGPDDFLDVRTASDAFGGNRATSIGFYTVPRTGTLVANERMRITPEGYVGINTISPSVSLDVFGDVSASNLYVTSTLGTVSSSYTHGHYASFTTLTAGRLYGDGSGLTSVTVDASDRIVSGTTSVVTHQGNSISLSTNNIERLALTNGGITVYGNTALYPAGAGARSVHVQADTMFDGVSNVIRFRQGTSTANAVLFSFYDNTSPPLVLRNYSGVGHVGIGMMSPTAALHVSGTISATNAIQVGTSSLTCTSDIAGAIRYNGGSLELCNGTTWSALGGGGGGGATDSVVSGTSHRTRVVAISTTGYISITQNNVNTAWFAPARGLSAVGVSATGAVSGSIVYGRDGLFATSLSITSGGGWTNFANGGNGILFYHSWYTPLNMAQDKVGINTWGGGGPLNWANLQVSGSMIVSSTGMGANPTLWAGTNGRVSVGIANPSYNFQVSGSIAYSGPLVDLSDRRYKTDIKALASSLEQLLALEPVSFRMKQNPGQQELGFIAQDVEKLFPDLVLTADDPSATKSLNYVGLIAPMVKGMQELKAENDHLRAKVIKLEAANDNFE